MGRTLRAGLGLALLALVMPAAVSAQEAESRPAAGTDIYFSADSDETEVIRLGVDFDLRNAGEDERLGARVEKAWYDPVGSGTRERERAFVQFADTFGAWTLRARVGTDRDTVIGSASLFDDAAWRKEFFIERDVVETRQGLDLGIYSTFAGAAIDMPIDERNVITLVTGLQAFTGDNLRLHVRGNYVHVLKPEWGLSAQLRGRYFRDSEPGEFDYYSPRWYAQALPVLQVRRFVGGWELLGAGGIGLQRDANSDWRQSNFAQARVTSPRDARNWSVRGELLYTNNPSNSAVVGDGYSYFQGTLGITRRF